MGLSTHVLDTAAGAPSAGVPVSLSVLVDGGAEGAPGAWSPLVTTSTDDDGRVTLLRGGVEAGTYRMRFDTSSASPFFPEVTVVFTVGAGDRRHLHVPLLLSPFGYSTYRGS